MILYLYILLFDKKLIYGLLKYERVFTFCTIWDLNYKIHKI